MINGKLRSEIYKEKKPNIKYQGTPITIMCDDGVCSVSSSVEICGIQLDLLGSGNITPTIPKDWSFKGNKNKLLMFNINLGSLQNEQLFIYQGTLKIKKAVFCDKEGNIIPHKTFSSPTSLGALEWTFDGEGQSWDKHKSRKRQGNYGKIVYRERKSDPLNIAEKDINSELKNNTTQSSSTGGGY